MTTLSKKAQAIALYSKIAGTNKDNRPEVVRSLMEKVGLTEQGAQTYYSNMKNGIWSLSAAPMARHGTSHTSTQGRVSRFVSRAMKLIRNQTIDELSIDELNDLYTKVCGDAGHRHYTRRGVVVSRIKESLRDQGVLENSSS